MGQFNIRDMPERSLQQLEDLQQWSGYTKTQMVLIAIDRLWLDTKHDRNKRVTKERENNMLQWNSRSNQYEATINGQLVQIDGDEFSEERAKLQKEYQLGGMSEDAAYQKAEKELSSVYAWRSDI